MLVVDDKWNTTLRVVINGEVEKNTQNFTLRVQELAVRYATPLLNFENDVETLNSKVEKHLKNMGFKWE